LQLTNTSIYQYKYPHSHHISTLKLIIVNINNVNIYYIFHRIFALIFYFLYPPFLLLRTGEIHFTHLLHSRNVRMGKNGGKRWKVTELGNSNLQINLGWFVEGHTSYRFHFQDNVCGNTGGQFAFVLFIREINKCN
jgi:hypothetical protein